MNDRLAFTVDLGSTYTKGALLSLNGAASRVLEQARVPTTQHNLAEGVARIINRLLNKPDGVMPSPLPAPVYVCSSAKGGLRIVAVGIVPDLTLQAARLAACSAGGKVVAHYAYRLTDQNIAAIEAIAPDIILLTGGTDGGNETYNRYNAEKLALSRFAGVVLYAGNAQLQDEIRRLLRGKILVVTDNLLPEIERLNIEPARAAIQKIFLEKIVAGKGLASVAAISAAPLKPTPLAVFDLLATIVRETPEWDDLILIDMGGATTDFYSCTKSFTGDKAVVLRGLVEPEMKRTVEGDLGLRVNARSVYESATDWFNQCLAGKKTPPARLAQYIDLVSRQIEHLPADDEEKWFDLLLAEQCIRQATLRHAGRLEEVYTAQGKVYVQKGKDLRRVRRVIGSGGFLASSGDGLWMENIFSVLCRESGMALLAPEHPSYFFDAPYLVPLAANLAAVEPQAAAALVLNGLRAATP